jgi:putative hydrolase of the HAD superfamily
MKRVTVKLLQAGMVAAPFCACYDWRGAAQQGNRFAIHYLEHHLMIKVIIFDLSDVLITGLTGIEERLHVYLSSPKEEILRQFRSDIMLDFLLGYCSEEEYLQKLKLEYRWELSVDELKRIIREHFKKVIPGAEEIVTSLSNHYPLFLLSDHGREWIEYIETEHTFLKLFRLRFYSFEMHTRKNNPDTYRKVLSQIGVMPEACLFIDDRPMFLDVAKEVGLNTLQFENSTQLKAALERYSINL